MGALLPLASFSFEPAPVPSANVGEKGREAWLPISQLRIDDSYQRPIDQAGRKTIRGIIEHFSWNKFAPLVVAPRPGGLYAVVDGQHRAVACALHGGIQEVPCHILSCTEEEEAAAFATINGIVTRMHPQYLFRARIAAGDKKAVAANEAAQAAGVKIMAYPVAASFLKVGETLSGKTIELELERVGRTALVAALELITRTGSGNAGMVKASIIEAFCDVYSTHPKWLAAHDECQRVVHRKTLRDIYARAAQRQVNDGGSLRSHIAAVLSDTLAESLGDGGKTTNQVQVAKAEKLKEARKGRVPVAFSKKPKDETPGNVKALTPADMRRPHFDKAPAKAMVAKDERAMIDAHLAKHGARKVESAASGQVHNMIDWVRMNCGVEITTHGIVTKRFYQIGRKKVDLPGLYRFVNEERAKRNLQPLTVAK